LALEHQLKLAQQREQEAQRQKYDAERRLSAMLRNPTSSAQL
jgi:YD repeat-containing protein